VEFSPYLERLKGGTFRPCLPLTLFLKSIGENMVTMIIWFLNLRNSCTLFDVCFLTSAQHIFIFHPTLMGKGKGYNSSHAYCQVKGWFKKSYETFSNDFGNGFENDMMEGEKMDSRKKIFEVEIFFSSQNFDFPILFAETLRAFLFSFLF
jgi:hypothetical protein